MKGFYLFSPAVGDLDIHLLFIGLDVDHLPVMVHQYRKINRVTPFTIDVVMKMTAHHQINICFV